MAENQVINIDNVEYRVDDFSDEAKSHIAGLQLSDQKLQQLQQELAMVRMARMGYAAALKEALPAPVEKDEADIEIE